MRTLLHPVHKVRHVLGMTIKASAPSPASNEVARPRMQPMRTLAPEHHPKVRHVLGTTLNSSTNLQGTRSPLLSQGLRPNTNRKLAFDFPPTPPLVPLIGDACTAGDDLDPTGTSDDNNPLTAELAALDDMEDHRCPGTSDYLHFVIAEQSLTQIRRFTGLTRDHTLLQARLFLWCVKIASTLPQPPSTDSLWQHLCTALAETPAMAVSTQIKHLATLIGVTKRSATFATVLDTLNPLITTPRPPQFVYDRIQTLRTQARILQDLDLPEITPTEVQSILTSMMDVRQTRHRQAELSQLYLAMLYPSAARSTSIVGLHRNDVRFVHSSLDTATHTCVSLRFREGKTIRSTGTYTVHILLDHHMIQLLKRQLTCTTDDYLFGPERHKIAQQVSTTLLSKGHSIRACRRGCLRFLARRGVSVRDLLLLSRHTTPQALYTYLGGGLHLQIEAQSMMMMSQFLISA